MKIVSLFSGAGGLDLGFIKAGHQIVWANDLYEDAVETYRANIGNHIVCRDSIDEDVLSALKRKDITQQNLIKAVKARLVI